MRGLPDYSQVSLSSLLFIDYFHCSQKRVAGYFMTVNLNARFIVNEKLCAVVAVEDCYQKAVDFDYLHFVYLVCLLVNCLTEINFIIHYVELSIQNCKFTVFYCNYFLHGVSWFQYGKDGT